MQSPGGLLPESAHSFLCKTFPGMTLQQKNTGDGQASVSVWRASRETGLKSVQDGN